MPRRSPRPYRRRSARPAAALVLAVILMGSGFAVCQPVRAEVVQVTQNRSWMSEEAMRADFAGQTLDGHYGSGTTWTETYFADGRIDYRESNRTAQGHWHFRGGVVFCTFYDPPYSPAFVGGCWQVIKTGIDYMQHRGQYDPGDLLITVTYFLAFMACDTAAVALAFAMERGEKWGLLLLLALQRFGYRQILYWVVLKSVFSAGAGALVGWGKLERKGTVTAQ